MRSYAVRLCSSRAAARTMRRGSVPTSSPPPASSSSGRSVVSRSTSTGLPSAGASSCKPPESVRIRQDRCASRRKSPYDTGSTRSIEGSPASSRHTTSRTRGLGCIGKRMRVSVNRRVISRSAAQIAASGAPSVSRRCAVTSSIRPFPVSASSRASSNALSGRNSSIASITVFPVTQIESPLTPSRSRLSRARAVGAKCSSARFPMRRRFISSGNGDTR